jgi:hypothetical protein
MATTKNNKNMAVGLGTAVAVGAAAIAGAYFLYGKEGAKHRKQVKGWMLKARGEVLDKLEKVGEWNQVAYHKAIDEVATKYRTLKNVDQDELSALVLDLKRHWNNISRQLSSSAKRKRPAARKRRPVAKKKSE